MVGDNARVARLLYELGALSERGDELGVHDVRSLRRALDDHRVRTLRGLGPATERRIAQALADLQGDVTPQDALPIGGAVPHATRAARRVAALNGVRDVAWAGDLGRLADTVRRIHLVASTPAPTAVLTAVAALPMVRETSDHGDGGVTLHTFDGPRVRLTAVPPAVMGPAALHATASDAHWRALQRLATGRGLHLTPTACAAPAARCARRPAPTRSTPRWTCSRCRPNSATAPMSSPSLHAVGCHAARRPTTCAGTCTTTPTGPATAA